MKITNDCLKLDWTKLHLITKKDIDLLQLAFKKYMPDYSGADTETTGLHITLDKPFFVSYGWYNESTKKALVITFDLTTNPELNNYFFKTIFELSNKTKEFLFWHASFDLNMFMNVDNPYPYDNVVDVQGYVRLCTDAESGKTKKLSLKTYAKLNLDPKAKFYLEKIEKEKQDLNKFRRTLIEKSGFSLKKLDKILKDKLNTLEDLPEEIQEIYKNTLDPNNYINYNRNIIIDYAAYDVIYTLEAHYHLKNILKERNQEEILKMENQLIPIVTNMERTGFELNKEYAIKSKPILKKYILDNREKFKALMGANITVNQHKEIKNLFLEKFNIVLENSDVDTFKKLLNHSNKRIREISKIIIIQRSLEKWYSTYLVKWTETMSKTNRIHPSLNQFGAVSGRFTSNFQQFPKYSIKDENDQELFNPRKLVKVTNEEYPILAFIDYNQIELRFQALYTIFLAEGDLNLCRVFMPFRCHTKDEKSVYFDYNNEEHIRTYNSKKWFLNENSAQEWHKLDFHSYTTLTAFPELKLEDPNFKKYRSIGKQTNFSINYGATVNKLMEEFGYSKELAKKLYDAYYKSFPIIKTFIQYIKRTLYKQDYISNLFGRRYYNTNAHKGRSYIVQGSAADFIKIQMIECFNEILKNKKTRMIMQIHDELIFEIHKDEVYIIKQLKELMQNLPDTKIPIEAEVEISYTTWADKKKVNLEDLK